MAAKLGGLVVDLPGKVFEELIVADFVLKKGGVLAAEAFLPGIFDKKLALGKGRGGKRIRLDDIRSGFEEAFVDVADDVGPRQGEDIAVVEEILVVFRKALTSCVLFGQSVTTDSRAHGPVEDEDSFGELCSQLKS